LIGEHPCYAFLPHELRFHAEPDGLPGVLEGTVPPAEFVARMRQRWWRRRDSSGRERGLDQLVPHIRFNEVLAEFEPAAAGDPAASGGRLIRTLVDPIAAEQNKPSWVEMTPYNALSAVRLSELLPDARFVHVLRDGRDVAASVERLWGFDFGAALEWWARRLRRIQLEAAALPPGRALTVRLERLASSEGERNYGRLLEFLELDDEAGMRRFLNDSLLAERVRPGHWREGRSEREAGEIDRRYRELLERLPEAPSER
jgi:hypothetical protein